MYLIFLTPLVPSVQKTVNLLHRFNQIYKPSNINVVSVDHHSAAWQCISLAETVKGFKKCCISSAVHETDGDMLWNGSEEGGDVRRECEEDEGTDCEGDESDNALQLDRHSLLN